MSSFAFLKPANQLWKDAKISKVHKRILERITDMPHEIRENKHNMELLSLICNMIENSGIKNREKNDKLKIDKKQLLIQIYKSLYGNLTPQDCEILSKNIEFLHDNNHIVTHPWYRLVTSCLVDWLKRKVL
jgi:translation initiation factor 2B subunit (eIF-2B alpha/beta/delta family)